MRDILIILCIPVMAGLLAFSVVLGTHSAINLVDYWEDGAKDAVREAERRGYQKGQRQEYDACIDRHWKLKVTGAEAHGACKGTL